MDSPETVDEAAILAVAHRDGIRRIVVGAVVPRIQNQGLAVLVLDRRADDYMGGIVELPSGKVEDGETLLAAMSRELAEETGLTGLHLMSECFSFDYMFGSGIPTRQVNFLICQPIGDEVRVDAGEHVGYRWICREEVEESRLTDTVRAALLAEWNALEARLLQHQHACNEP